MINVKEVKEVKIIEKAVNENAKMNDFTNYNFIAGDVAKVITELKDMFPNIPHCETVVKLM